MPIYCYLNPKTKQIFEEIRSFSDHGKPFVLEDGTICHMVHQWNIGDTFGIIDRSAEVWEKDPAYVKDLNPKYVRRRDGIKERYDPTRHC
jgi:hypothetical protein